MKSLQARSLLDVIGPDGSGGIAFGQPDNDEDCSTYMLMPEARWTALGSPAQITVTIETGDQLNNEDGSAERLDVVAVQEKAEPARTREPFTWPTINGVTGPESLEEAVGLAGGAFSMCWHESGVFDDQTAREVYAALMQYIEANYVPRTVDGVVPGSVVFGG